MSKLNKKNDEASVIQAKLDSGKFTYSYQGNLQRVKEIKQQLFELAVTTMYGKDSFYESTDDKVLRIKALISEIVLAGGADYVANLIVFARSSMNIRTIPIVMAVHFVEAIRDAKTKIEGFTYNPRQVIVDVIQRADQLMDLYAYSLAVFGEKGKIPLSIKKGVADAFNKFDEYQFAKWKSDGKQVTLSRLLRVVHPKPKNTTQGDIFAKIMADTLEIPFTWETELSIDAQKPIAEQKGKKAIWEELINSGRLPYNAMIANLRNIIEANVDKNSLTVLGDLIKNQRSIERSGILPFKFVQALRVTSHISPNIITNALQDALELSFSNVPHIGDNVWVILDVSCSMRNWSYSAANSKRPSHYNSPIDVASMMTAAIVKGCKSSMNSTVTLFSDNAANLKLNPRDSLMTIQSIIGQNVYGGGTRLQAALDLKKNLGYEPDAVIIVSDMQVNRLRASNVSSLFTKDCVKIAFNFEGYESSPVGEIDGWYQVAGLTEKVFDFIKMYGDGESIVSKLSVPYIGSDIKNQIKV